jgi:hypothetical protein
MDTTTLKHLNDCIRQLATDLKRCRAAQQILDGYARLNSSGDGIAMAIVELQAATDELAKHSRQYAKAVSDLSATVITTSTATVEEMQQ